MRLVNANTVMARLGEISRVTLWPYLKDPELGFPRPIVMRKRRFWREDELSDWIASRAA